MIRKVSLICFVCCTLAGATGAGADVSSSPAAFTQTRVFLGAREICRTKPPATTTENAVALLTPLAAAVAGKVVQSGTGELSNYVAGVLRNESAAITLNVESTYLYQFQKDIKGHWVVSPALDCVAIVRGRYGALDTRSLAASAVKMDPRQRFGRPDEHRVLDFTVLRDLGLADYPDLYLELAVERDVFNTTFRLKPQVIYYRQTSVRVPNDKRVDLNIVLAFSRPDGTPLGILPLRLSGLQVGIDYPPEAIKVTSPWVTMPQRPDSKALLASSLGRLGAVVPAVPTNVTVSIEETGTPQPFMVFLSRALGGSEADLGKATNEGVREILKQKPKSSREE